MKLRPVISVSLLWVKLTQIPPSRPISTTTMSGFKSMVYFSLMTLAYNWYPSIDWQKALRTNTDICQQDRDLRWPSAIPSTSPQPSKICSGWLGYPLQHSRRYCGMVQREILPCFLFCQWKIQLDQSPSVDGLQLDSFLQ